MTKRSTANANTEKSIPPAMSRRISTSTTPCCESLRQQHLNNSKHHGALAKIGGNIQAGHRPFFFLRYGRSRSEARSLHEKKQFKISSIDTCGHVGWQIKSTNKTQTQTTRGETQIPQPDMRFAIQQRNKAKANGARPNKTIQAGTDLQSATIFPGIHSLHLPIAPFFAKTVTAAISFAQTHDPQRPQLRLQKSHQFQARLRIGTRTKRGFLSVGTRNHTILLLKSQQG